jgi:Spy/CpxP family protein refolding chaperone
MKIKTPVIATVLGLVLLPGLALAAATTAVPPPTAAAPAPVGPSDEFLARAADKLGLSAEQQKTLADLHAKQRAELQALRASADLTPDVRRDKAQAIVESYRAQMHAVLTPEQQKLAGEWHGRAGQRFREAGQHDQGFFPGRNGSDDRREPALHPGRADNPLAIVAMGERIKDRIAEKLQLTDEQQDKLEHLGRAYRAQQRDAAKKHREELRAVLTPEQQQKVEQWKQHHGRGPGGKHVLSVGMDDDAGDMRVAGMDTRAGERLESPEEN